MTAWQFFVHRLLRWPLRSFGAFPTKPFLGMDYGLPFSLGVLADHGTVFIFPEGRMVRGPRIEARHGVEVLASTPDVEVILCRILWRKPWFTGVHVIMAKPKSYSGVPAQEILDDIYKLAS